MGAEGGAPRTTLLIQAAGGRPAGGDGSTAALHWATPPPARRRRPLSPEYSTTSSLPLRRANTPTWRGGKSRRVEAEWRRPWLACGAPVAT